MSDFFQLIADRPLIWGLFLGYMALTAVLAWMGHRKTSDIESFAIGKGDMHPMIVGVTLAASIASTATFVINPGFVYVHGLSALIHLGGAVSLGVALGLIVMSVGFRRIGAKHKALTLPQWIGQRYGSRGLSFAFAAINLLSLSFVVLIVGGLSIVMQRTLGLGNVESLVLIVVFVFGYVFVGGAYAHAYTNTLQGLIMTGIALVIIASGVHLLFDGAGDTLAAVNPNLVEAVNPESSLFGGFFSVYVSGLVIGFALVCQPHIMTKALYVKTDKQVWGFLAVAIVIGVVFSGLLLVGLYAHLGGVPPEAFADAATGAFRQDSVMIGYVTHTFSPTWVAVITVALMAAGMSTLDGILVALSSIAANDLYLNVADKRWLKHKTPAERARSGHRASQIVLVGMGVVALLIALDPPKLLGIFGQVGVYGIVAASAVPILLGIVAPRFTGKGAGWAAATGLLVHFGLYWLGAERPELGLANPGVTATWGLLASLGVGLGSLLWTTISERAADPEPTSTPATARIRRGGAS